jgi:release factor glutamine methyltransferase
VPRPQTEDLARRAVALLPAGAAAVDLCTGTGAIAAFLASEVPSASVLGVDRDPKAVACARSNGVAAVEADVEDEFAEPGTFDLVTAVPPYVPTGELRTLAADVRRWEPRTALDGGPDGLDTARRIVAASARLLKPEGWLVIELGGAQDDDLAPALNAAGFHSIDQWYDEEGDLRGLAATRY